MIEELSLTTVQKALTVVNECLLSFSPSSLSLSLSYSLSLCFQSARFNSFSLLYPSPSFSFRAEEGRTPFLERIFTLRLFRQRPLAALHNPYFRHVFAHVFFSTTMHTEAATRKFSSRRQTAPQTMSTLSSLTAATIKVTFHFVYSKWTAYARVFITACIHVDTHGISKDLDLNINFTNDINL